MHKVFGWIALGAAVPTGLGLLIAAIQALSDGDSIWLLVGAAMCAILALLSGAGWHATRPSGAREQPGEDAPSPAPQAAIQQVAGPVSSGNAIQVGGNVEGGIVIGQPRPADEPPPQLGVSTDMHRHYAYLHVKNLGATDTFTVLLTPAQPTRSIGAGYPLHLLWSGNVRDRTLRNGEADWLPILSLEPGRIVDHMIRDELRAKITERKSRGLYEVLYGPQVGFSVAGMAMVTVQAEEAQSFHVQVLSSKRAAVEWDITFGVCAQPEALIIPFTAEASAQTKATHQQHLEKMHELLAHMREEGKLGEQVEAD